MKEFIDKLISELKEEHEGFINRYGIVGGNVPASIVKRCMNIVNELAEEYKGGWIPCSERLPEEKHNPITYDYMQYPVMVNIGGTVDLRYYYYGNGHWRFGFQIMDKYVTHWMDIAPYTEGEYI